MVRAMNMLVFMVFLGAAIQCCSSQTTHEVGGSLGWTVPPGGPIAYSTWAGNETFVVGDILVFNFTTGAHDVAKVTKAAYDSCNSASPLSLQANGPANVNLNQSGEHYFICTVGRHCSLGQKLAVNVTGRSAPTPSPSPAATPSSPPPATTPSPSPAASPSSPPPATTPSPSPAATPSSPPPATTPSPSPPSPPSSTAPTPSSSTSPPPPSTTTPPPPGNAAASLSGLFSGMLSVAVVLLY